MLRGGSAGDGATTVCMCTPSSSSYDDDDDGDDGADADDDADDEDTINDPSRLPLVARAGPSH